MKLTPVPCQALGELGLENNVLVQLRIGLDRNVRELVWIQFWLEEKPPPSAPIQSLAGGSTSWGAQGCGQVLPHHQRLCSLPASRWLGLPKLLKIKRRAEKPGESRGSLYQTLHNCSSHSPTTTDTARPGAHSHTLLHHTQGRDQQVTAASRSDGSLFCPKTPKLRGPGKVKGLHSHRWGAGETVPAACSRVYGFLAKEG